MDHDAAITAAQNAREAFWKSHGQLGEHFAPILSNSLMGGPVWPSREGWQEVRLPDAVTLVSSNGLSDPWEDEPGTGLGLEVYMATAQEVGPLMRSWLMSAVRELSMTCAGHGGVAELLDELGPVSVEVGGEAFPASLRNEPGRVGVLLGVESPLPATLDLPLGPARLVCARVLSLDELNDVLARGEEARRELADSGWLSAV